MPKQRENVVILLRFSISVSTEDKKMLAKATATFVLIAVVCMFRDRFQVFSVNSNEFSWRITKGIFWGIGWGQGCFPKMSYALHTMFFPSSCGIFVYRVVTSKETRNVSSGRVLLSIKFTTADIPPFGGSTVSCHDRSANGCWLMNLCGSVENTYSGWIRSVW